jgi:hypothetical protein
MRVAACPGTRGRARFRSCAGRRRAGPAAVADDVVQRSVRGHVRPGRHAVHLRLSRRFDRPARQPRARSSRPLRSNRPSALTVDRDREGAADLSQAPVGQTAESFDQDAGCDTLDRVEVDGRTARDRIVAGFEDDLAGQRPDGCRARRDEHSPEPRDGRVARQDNDGTPANISQLAPPHLTPSGEGVHDAPAARRNDARSPHSSGSSSGCSS